MTDLGQVAGDMIMIGVTLGVAEKTGLINKSDINPKQRQKRRRKGKKR